MHRVGDYASNDPELRRRCQSPLDALDETGEMRLVVLTDRGVCRAYEAAEEPVMVWTMSGSLERARERWGLTQEADKAQDYVRAVEQALTDDTQIGALRGVDGHHMRVSPSPTGAASVRGASEPSAPAELGALAEGWSTDADWQGA